jgi:3-deoxy-D-manno-oct-2-ulosonic acid (Kdo) hydroxylase
MWRTAPGGVYHESVELVSVTAPAPSDDYYLALERGNILFFPKTPFAFSDAERDVLRSSELSSSKHHKNIAYRPASDKVTGFDAAAVKDPERLRTVMRAYSERALAFLRSFLPRYMEGCRVDFASFRPLEEEGRNLPTKKRNDLLHVDSFPTRPTGGDLILRFFTNINATLPRVWLTSDPFEAIAKRYATDAGLPEISSQPDGPLMSRLLRGIGLPIPERSAYDRFMLGFHDYLKFNADYQRDCAKYRFEFPPDSTWMVFTDVVPHAVLSGQFALEQTVIVKRESLLKREHAPVTILESICRCPLVAKAS